MAATAVWPGDSYPLGATYDGAGTNFGLFSEVADRVELCLFDDDGTETRVDLHEVDGFVWHGYLPGISPGQRYGYRVHGPVQPGRGEALQPAQAADRPVRQGDRGPRHLGPAGVLLPVRAPGPAEQRRLRAVRPALGGGEPVLRLEPGPAAAHPLPRDRHLRGARPRPDQGAPGHPRRAARHLPGPGPPGGDLAPEGARRHGGRADAGAPVRHRQPPEREGPGQLLGLQHHRLLRPAQRATRPAAAAASRCRSSRPWSARCTGGHRGDPRRGLQPHRRGQPPGAHAVLPRHRQRRLLPAGGRRPALLHGHHRHREQPAHAAPARAPDDHGLAALLGARHARGRLQVRPGRHLGPPVLRGGPVVRVLRPGPAGPGGLPGEAHRRAVGRGRRRLPGRQLPAAVERVERQVPGHDPRLLARPARHPAGVRLPADRLQPTCTSRTAGARSPRSTSSPATTGSP